MKMKIKLKHNKKRYFAFLYECLVREMTKAVIEKKDEKKETKVDSEGEILHKGIAKRYFKKSFTIAEDVEVKGAELKDGLLRVALERIVPEHKKPRTISIK